MSKNFFKFENTVPLAWDMNYILSSITKEFSNIENSYKVVDVKTNDPYWQYYPYTHTCFSRNFGINFPKESIEVIEHLKNLQSMTKKEDIEDPIMFNTFIRHKFDYRRVGLIKAVAGVDILPHIDNGRKFVINIGLMNSNSCTTYVADSFNNKDFWNLSLESFTMEDGRAYILNVDKSHAVKSLVAAESKLDRYIVTYRLL